MKILLDYLFPITAIEPTPAASTAFLKQVLFVAKKKDSGVTTGVITECTTGTEIEALLTAQGAAEAEELLTAGMSKVYVLPNADLDLHTILANNPGLFHTILIGSDFSTSDITGANFGTFAGVIGVSSTDDTWNTTQAAISNRCAFHATSTNKAKNLAYAFGKLLSNSLDWKNQQYIPMPLADDVSTLGSANSLFDDRVSFVITDSEFSTRLAFFACGGKAIVQPYISRNLQIDLQSKAIGYISGNEPAYTKTQAALLEDELAKVIRSYIDRGWIEDGVIAITLEQDNFVASGEINIAEPKALWRIFGEMRQTL